MNEFVFEYNYNCKYCSTKSSFQNLHENFVESLWMNLLMNEFAFEYEYNCKYCSTKSSLQNLQENFNIFLWMSLLLNMNIIVSTV